MGDNLDKLISPNGFDGRGPTPAKVTEAAKRIAALRVKFISQWIPGADSPLTTSDVDRLFHASAVMAEWTRELVEAVDTIRDDRDAWKARAERLALEFRYVDTYTMRDDDREFVREVMRSS